MKETDRLHANGKHMLAVVDGYSCQNTLRTLSLQRSNGITVAGLPERISHELQSLYVGVFAPVKGAFK